MPRPPRDLLRAMFDAAVDVALPADTIPVHLPNPPKGRTLVVGAGKASAAIAKAVEDAWPWPLQGLVVTRYGHSVPCRRIEIAEAAHPVPDTNGQDAARRILDRVSGLTEHDLVLALISGGGSALLALPAPGLTLENKQAIKGDRGSRPLAGSSCRQDVNFQQCIIQRGAGRIARECARVCSPILTVPVFAIGSDGNGTFV